MQMLKCSPNFWYSLFSSSVSDKICFKTCKLPKNCVHGGLEYASFEISLKAHNIMFNHVGETLALIFCMVIKKESPVALLEFLPIYASTKMLSLSQYELFTSWCLQI